MSTSRIASLLAAGTEIVHALGLGEQLVAISHECDYPDTVLDRPRATRARIDPSRPSGEIDRQVRDALDAGLPLYELDVERLVSVAPDVIITQARCEVCAVDDRVVRQALLAAPALDKVRVIALQPTRLADLLEDVRRVADAVGATAAGRETVQRLETRIEAVRRRTATAKAGRRPRVACIEWTDPLMIAANWMPDMVELAGGVCSLTRPGEKSRVTPWEDLVAFDPEVIVVMPCGFDLPRAARELETLRSRPEWGRLSAVRKGGVFAVDGNACFNRSGPRLVDSLEMLEALLAAARNGDPRIPKGAARG